MRMRYASALLLMTGLSGCDLAPAYHPPQFILPASYAGSAAFSVAAPADDFDRGAWWKLFGDPTLNGLEDEADRNNPDLQAVAQAYLQSRDLAAEAESGLFPHVSTGGFLSDNKQSLNRLFRGNIHTPDFEASNEIEASASWEPDFWDEIRNETRAQKQLAQGSAAALAAARLSLEGQLASEYIALRGLDREDAVYQNALSYYKAAVNITRLRLSGDISSGLDVARAQDQLDATEALDTDLLANRAVLAHAIADLVGVSAGSFTLPPQNNVPMTVPDIPVQVPVALLQRRPDVAEAERSMAAANTSIGVSRAAFYPNGVINALTGIQDNGFNLLSLPNSLWSVGASVALPLFEGGLRQAELQRAWSAYAQTRDQYRATVLSAFQEVEDGLSLSQLLGTEAAQDKAALQAALTAQQLSLKLYTGGLSDYLDVVVSQEAALTAEIAVAGVETRRLQAAVKLIQALGGGWDAAQLPAEDQIMPFSPFGLDGHSQTATKQGAALLESPASDNLTGGAMGE